MPRLLMRKARFANPHGDLVDPVEFVSRAPANYRALQVLPYCDACHEVVHLYGVNTPNVETTPRFDHANLSKEANPLDDCILAQRTRRFRGMEPDGYDDARGEQLRKQFINDENLKTAYSFCLALCGKGNLPKSHFRSMIARADKKRVWSYVGIEVWAIPYILLTLEDFSAENKSGMSYGFHFVFDKRKGSNASAIWDTVNPCKLLKVYSDSGNPTHDSPFSVSKNALTLMAGNPSWVKLQGLLP